MDPWWLVVVLCVHGTGITSATTLSVGKIESGEEIYEADEAAAIFLTTMIVPVDNFRLAAFILYLNTRGRSSTDLRVQIYRPIENSKKELKLIAETEIPLLSDYLGEYTLELDAADYIPVQTGDRLGIFNKGPYVPIPFSTPGEVTPYNYGNSPPAINTVIAFGSISYPISFPFTVLLTNDSTLAYTPPYPTTSTAAEPTTSIVSTKMAMEPVTQTITTIQETTTTDNVLVRDERSQTTFPGCEKTTTGQSFEIHCESLIDGCSQRCVDTEDGYYCACLDGYRLDENDNSTCIDIVECEDNNGFCHHGCSNINGGYRCNCLDGFYLSIDRHSCIDVDECQDVKSKCTPKEICVNVPGSYVCVPESEKTCVTNEALPAHMVIGLLSRNTIIGYIVWLIILTILLFSFLITIFVRRHNTNDKHYYKSTDNPLYYDGPYNPQLEEQADREYMARMAEMQHDGALENTDL